MSSTSAFAVTDRAAERVAEIVAAQGRPAALRVAVLAGGCSGFQYKFELDETAQPMTSSFNRAPPGCSSTRPAWTCSPGRSSTTPTS